MTFPADPHGDQESSFDPNGDELGDVARLLRKLEPRVPAIDEARLMFLAGQESAFVAARRQRRDLFRWRVLAVVCGGVAAASLLVAFRRGGDSGTTAGPVPVATNSATALIASSATPPAIPVPQPGPVPVPAPVPVPSLPPNAVPTATTAEADSVSSTTMDEVCDRALALVAARRGWRTDLRSFVDGRGGPGDGGGLGGGGGGGGGDGAAENRGSTSPRTTLELRQAFLRDGLRSLDQPLP
ncbi:MAG: hypothetical protein ACKO38_03080 [Planctomycetota bacterium]